MRFTIQSIANLEVCDHDDMIRGTVGVTLMGERAYNEGDFNAYIAVGWGLPSWHYLTGKYWKSTIINWLADICQDIDEGDYHFTYVLFGFKLKLGWWY